jgi:hypothetical protein
VIGRREVLAFGGAAAGLLASAAHADVVMPGPPFIPIKLGPKAQAKRIAAANAAIAKIFDFSLPNRPTYLDEAYRSASENRIQDFVRIENTRLIGERTFTCAVVNRWLAVLMVGQSYAYFQCFFDDANGVNQIGVL